MRSRAEIRVRLLHQDPHLLHRDSPLGHLHEIRQDLRQTRRQSRLQSHHVSPIQDRHLLITNRQPAHPVILQVVRPVSRPLRQQSHRPGRKLHQQGLITDRSRISAQQIGIPQDHLEADLQELVLRLTNQLEINLW